jgi:Cu/Ag efflux protein CusF
MARLSGLVLLALGALLATLGTVLLITAALAAGGFAGALFAGGAVLFLIGVGLLISAVAVLGRTKPLGGPVPGAAASGTFAADTTETAEIDGSSYTVAYQTPIRGKHGRPSSLVVSTSVESDGEFRITGETGFDRICKSVGLAAELHLDDPDFDDTCFVRTDAVAFTEAYFRDPLKRVAVVDLRRLGFPEVCLANGRIEARWVGFDPAKDDRPDLTADAAARLILLSRNLPAPQPEFAARSGAWRKRWQFVLWGLLVAFALTLFSLLAYTPLSFWSLLGRAAVPLLLGWPAFGFVAATLLRGTSRSHVAWGALMFGSILLFPPGALGTVGLVNGLTDGSPEAVHDARVVRKYTTKSKNTTNHHVECQSWREPGETMSFRVGSAEYNRVVEGRSHLRVTTRAGGLGVEWLVSKQLAP